SGVWIKVGSRRVEGVTARHRAAVDQNATSVDRVVCHLTREGEQEVSMGRRREQREQTRQHAHPDFRYGHFRSSFAPAMHRCSAMSSSVQSVMEKPPVSIPGSGGEK